MSINNNTTDNFTSNKGSVVANRLMFWFKLNQAKEKYEKVDTILNWQFSLV